VISCAQQSREVEEGAPRSTSKPNRGSGNYLYIFGLLAAVLYLPYFIPQHPAASDAYVFGYNNRAGLILLVSLCAAFAIWKKGFELSLLPAGSPERVSRRALGTCIGIQLAACLTMVLIMRPFGGFGESTYVIDRIWLLAQGKTPYVGFEWPFGPLFLWGPLWITHLLHCNVAGGYYLFWIAASLAGVTLLAATINQLDYPSPHKTAIFALFFAALLPATLGMGTHYTWIRYITPVWCILVVHRASVRRSKESGGMHVAMLAVCCAGLLLLISP
jgi:hypothetical protein